MEGARSGKEAVYAQAAGAALEARGRSPGPERVTAHGEARSTGWERSTGSVVTFDPRTELAGLAAAAHEGAVDLWR
jgi:hypothetical protein